MGRYFLGLDRANDIVSAAGRRIAKKTHGDTETWYMHTACSSHIHDGQRIDVDDFQSDSNGSETYRVIVAGLLRQKIGSGVF